MFRDNLDPLLQRQTANGSQLFAQQATKGVVVKLFLRKIAHNSGVGSDRLRKIAGSGNKRKSSSRKTPEDITRLFFGLLDEPAFTKGFHRVRIQAARCDFDEPGMLAEEVAGLEFGIRLESFAVFEPRPLVYLKSKVVQSPPELCLCPCPWSCPY